MLLKLPLVKLMLIFVATLWKRLVNVAGPPAAFTVREPCRAAGARVASGGDYGAVVRIAVCGLRRLPNLSCTPMTGCRANITPAVAEDEGWV